MKKLTLLSAILILTVFTGFGQSRALKSFQQDFKGDDDVDFISINGNMLKLATWVASIADEDDEDVQMARKISKDVRRVQIMEIDNWKNLVGRSELERLERDLVDEKYEILLSARENGDDVRVYSRFDNDNYLKDVIIVADQGYDLAIINIDGRFDKDTLAYLINNGDLY